MADQHPLYGRSILSPEEQRRVAQASDEDNLMYTTNSLASFAFGSASELPPSPSRHNIGPLDEIDEEDPYTSRKADDTPRQSLATGKDQRSPSSFYSQPPSDTASRHTFGGNSSTSSRSGSRSRTTSSTTHTSVDDLGGVTFNPLHHHPTLPPDVEFDSEEELSEEYDSIEVSSAHGTSSMDGAAFEALLERQMYADSHMASTGRRPSLPMAIPGTSPDDYNHNRRDREGSLATLRRPSRSLDDPVSIYTGRDSPTSSPPTPVSVPESDGDWRSLSARVASREPPSPQTVIVPTFAGGSGAGSGGFDSYGFDLDWSSMQGGITGLDMRDIAVHAGRTSTHSERRPSQLSLMLRRPSTASGGSVMLDPDTFAAAVRGWGGDEYERQRKYWTFRRDAADGRGGTSKRSVSSSGGPLSPVRSITSGRAGRSSDRGSDRPKSTPWRGMALNAEEIWNSTLVGSFKVRRIELRPQKPQQRVTIDPFRGPYTLGPKPPHDGAYTNIHKHSKVVAFSIHRHYKPTRLPLDARGSISGRGSITGSVSAGAGAYEERRRPTAMILLAPRHVQEAYTSTNTTKGLRSHGLLDEGKSTVRDETKRRDRERSSRRQQQQQQQTSSMGSVRSTTSTFREPPLPTPPIPQAPSVDSIPDTTRSHSASRRRRRRNSLDGDDSDSESERLRSRTTHNEAFSTMDASFIDQMVLSQDVRGDGSPNGVLSRVFGRGQPQPLLKPHAPYVPPWVTLQSRVKQEERKRRHDVLSNSFEDVGLLPPKRSTGARSGLKKSTVPSAAVDIFAQVPADSLFMLLPLWPGPTDPVSERTTSRPQHQIPPEQRQYLLVAYNPTDEPPPLSSSKTRSSHSSPTSSSDSTLVGGGRGSCDILLTSFHVSARLVSHQDLQGSGVRVPDEGLAVLGSWQDAWLSMPQIATRDHGLLVIGTCSSAREAGIEFDPEGLVKMGLCIPVPPEPGSSEEEEPVAELTPIGRAVLEMAWIGCIAVTSFGPAGMQG
ncbi:hypothetical protein MIND_00100200 [Mycena indigotica]|uniref:Uncharacterized protein n=1 Tax=Mycena indigotica TaxID=2126181 RepID=A0A8H6TC51_9AGAR|nr:uncharacterized protein MIND_00100200 [Mycena indigotica]KAF7315838.1 hypothetical protein MIND_00100200 [Mycena indigotica]